MIWQSKAQNGICAEDLNQIWLEVDLFEWEFSENTTRNIVFQDDVRKIWPSKAQNGNCAQDLNQPIRLKPIVIFSKLRLLSGVCLGRVPEFLNSGEL